MFHRHGKPVFLLITLVLALVLQPLLNDYQVCPTAKNSFSHQCPCHTPDQDDCPASEPPACNPCSLGGSSQMTLLSRSSGLLPAPVTPVPAITLTNFPLAPHSEFFRPPRS